jgi:hypothetical protein
MKKIFIVLMILVFAATSWAADLKSVGKTADAAVTTGSGYLKGIIAHTDGTNSVTFAVYDHATAASGSKLFSTLTVTTSSANRATVISFDDHECPYVNGIYVDITTSGTITYDVYFESN